MTTVKTFLDNAYGVETPEDVKALYQDWSKSYDAEVTENGYASPRRAAEALAGVTEDRAMPVLDLGCGTGISGEALRAVGFGTIDGSDFSEPMLEAARAKGLYRTLIPADVAEPLPFADGAYGAIAAVGVFSPAHAPPETIDAVMAKLSPGGLFVFSINDHALEDPAYEGRINEQVDCGRARVLFREYGDHLPKIGLGSLIYVLEAT